MTTQQIEEGAPARSAPSWLLYAGCLLAAIGIARSTAHGTQDGPGTVVLQAPPFTPSSLGTADSNNRMIAVTGIDITGSSILYLVDTVNPHIAIYQASGGSASTQGVRLVGARRIDLDLQLDGLNDKSDFTYKDLEERFSEEGLLPAAAPDSE